MDDNNKNFVKHIKKAMFEVIQTPTFKKTIASCQSIENHVSKRKTKNWVAITASVISIVGIIFGWHDTMNELKAHDIQARIDLKRTWQHNILSTMNGIRLARIVSRIKCTSGQASKQDQQLLRSNARYALVNMVTGSESVYGKVVNDQLLEQTRGLIIFDEAIKDVCHENPKISDGNWLSYVENADNIITHAINLDQKQLESIT